MEINCEHWTPNESPNHGNCALKLFSGNPAKLTCLTKCSVLNPGIKNQISHDPQVMINTSGRRVTQPTITHVSRDQWPLWARFLARKAMSSDAGLGDVVERLLGTAGARFKRWWMRRGVDCGCAGRKGQLNRLYPLTPK